MSVSARSPSLLLSAGGCFSLNSAARRRSSLMDRPGTAPGGQGTDGGCRPPPPAGTHAARGRPDAVPGSGARAARASAAPRGGHAAQRACQRRRRRAAHRPRRHPPTPPPAGTPRRRLPRAVCCADGRAAHRVQGGHRLGGQEASRGAPPACLPASVHRQPWGPRRDPPPTATHAHHPCLPAGDHSGGGPSPGGRGAHQDSRHRAVPHRQLHPGWARPRGALPLVGAPASPAGQAPG